MRQLRECGVGSGSGAARPSAVTATRSAGPEWACALPPPTKVRQQARRCQHPPHPEHQYSLRRVGLAHFRFAHLLLRRQVHQHAHQHAHQRRGGFRQHQPRRPAPGFPERFPRSGLGWGGKSWPRKCGECAARSQCRRRGRCACLAPPCVPPALDALQTARPWIGRRSSLRRHPQTPYLVRFPPVHGGHPPLQEEAAGYTPHYQLQHQRHDRATSGPAPAQSATNQRPTLAPASFRGAPVPPHSLARLTRRRLRCRPCFPARSPPPCRPASPARLRAGCGILFPRSRS